MSEKIIIDTDGGADDLLALLLAHSIHKKNILYIASYGAFPLAQTIQRVRFFFSELHLTTPSLISGSNKPLTLRYFPTQEIHGTAFTKQQQSFPITTYYALLSKVFTLRMQALTGDYTYITLGPLTNLARLLNTPFRTRIKKIICMGGALTTSGNATPSAEANFFWDPTAVEAVVSSGIPIYLLPLDSTEPFQLTTSLSKDWEKNPVIAKLLKPYAHYYMQKNKNRNLKRSYKGPVLHDVLTVAYGLNPSLFTTKNTTVSLTKLHTDQGKISVSLQNKSRAKTYTLTVVSCTNYSAVWKFVYKALNQNKR